MSMSAASRREPFFNLPGAVVVLAAAMVGIHVVRAFLGDEQDLDLLALFAFVPDRLLPPDLAHYAYPGGEGARVWTFLTYAFLHADGLHLLVNVPIFAALGTVIWRRFGTLRFSLLVVVSAVAAAATHLASHWGEAVPVIGASGIVSGLMGALTRFAFVPGGPMAPDSIGRDGHAVGQFAAARRPALGLVASLTDGKVVRFTLVFLALNALLAYGAEYLVGAGGSIAWEAHIGGYAAGFLLFGLLDPVGRHGS